MKICEELKIFYQTCSCISVCRKGQFSNDPLLKHSKICFVISIQNQGLLKMWWVSNYILIVWIYMWILCIVVLCYIPFLHTLIFKPAFLCWTHRKHWQFFWLQDKRSVCLWSHTSCVTVGQYIGIWKVGNDENVIILPIGVFWFFSVVSILRNAVWRWAQHMPSHFI